MSNKKNKNSKKRQRSPLRSPWSIAKVSKDSNGPSPPKKKHRKRLSPKKTHSSPYQCRQRLFHKRSQPTTPSIAEIVNNSNTNISNTNTNNSNANNSNANNSNAIIITSDHSEPDEQSADNDDDANDVNVPSPEPNESHVDKKRISDRIALYKKKRKKVQFDNKSIAERNAYFRKGINKWSIDYDCKLELDLEVGGLWCFVCKETKAMKIPIFSTKKSNLNRHFFEDTKTRDYNGNHLNAKKVYIMQQNGSLQNLIDLGFDRMTKQRMITARNAYYTAKSFGAIHRTRDLNRYLTLNGTETGGVRHLSEGNRNEWIKAASNMIESDTDKIFWNDFRSQGIGIDGTTAQSSSKRIAISLFGAYNLKHRQMFGKILEMKSGSATGQQIYDEVTSWLHSKGKTWKDLDFVGVDGARENHTTFARLVKEQNPHIKIIWCWCHKGHLLAGDLIKYIRELLQQETYDNKLCDKLRNSPKNTAHLKKAQKTTGEVTRKGGQKMVIKANTRWLSGGLQAQRLITSSLSIRYCINDCIASTSEAKARATLEGLKKVIHGAHWTFLEGYRCDIYSAQNEFVGSLQYESSLCCRLPAKLIRLKRKVKAYSKISTKGPALKKMFEYKDNQNNISDDGKSMEWGRGNYVFTLTHFGLPRSKTIHDFFGEDGILQSIMTRSKNYLFERIDARFKDHETQEIQNAETLLMPRCIPEDEISRENHAATLIVDVGNMFIERGKKIDVDELCLEYAQYKDLIHQNRYIFKDYILEEQFNIDNVNDLHDDLALIESDDDDDDDDDDEDDDIEDEKEEKKQNKKKKEKKKKLARFEDVYATFIRSHCSTMPNMRVVLNYYIAWPAVNTGPESIFSTHKAVASGYRATSAEIADYIIRIIRDGPPVDRFDAPRSVRIWCGFKKRYPLVNTMKYQLPKPLEIQNKMFCIKKERLSVFSSLFPF